LLGYKTQDTTAGPTKARRKSHLKPQDSARFCADSRGFSAVDRSSNLSRRQQTYYRRTIAFALQAGPVIRRRIIHTNFVHTPKGKLP
jgi:hypothetical protein